MQKVITKNFDVPGMRELKVALQNGAYSSLQKLTKLSRAETTEIVKLSGLRGRGGAGFSAGVKWGFIPKENKKPVYLVINADESEPGTFKDRAIIEKDPHLVVEGAIIAAYAINASAVFIYFRGEYARQSQIFAKALEEARAAGYIGKNIKDLGIDVNIIVHRGAGAYICGEETALLMSIEGRRGWPRIKPPFPAVSGLFGCPTIINNVETISALPFIIREGAEGYRKMGTEKSPGTKLISVCGHVERPGVYEIPLGMPLSTFLAEYAGGTLEGKKLKAVIPGGSSVAVLTAKEALATRIDFESLASSGSSLGSGGMIVIAEPTCMVRTLADLAKFYAHESCGQCTPCREGTGWTKKILNRIESGKGSPGDAELLVDIANNMVGRTVCVLAEALAVPIRSFISKFRDEFDEHIKLGKCKNSPPFVREGEGG